MEKWAENAHLYALCQNGVTQSSAIQSEHDHPMTQMLSNDNILID